MEFSPLGLAVSLVVFAPTLLLVRFAPKGAQPSARIPWPITWAERAGQVSCIAVPAFTGSAGGGWPSLIVMIAALIGYYALWIRYLTGGRSWALLYQPVWGIPVPMAILPVVYFFAAAAWLGSWWIACAALLLAFGHIPAALLIARTSVPVDEAPAV